MDELSTYTSDSPTKRRHLRPVPRQSASPGLRRRSSVTSIQSHTMSDSDQSEIIAPIPRKHMSLQGPRWLHSPSPEPSPGSPAPHFLFPLKRGAHRYASFAIDPPPNIGFTPRKEPEHGLARRWLRWMHKDGLKTWILPCIILSTTWIKWCISLGSYSGQGTPPLFGDYEAQRHWMELTINLPIKQWYTYDLEYWGLDYPPLTAYVSWICGKVGSWIDPSWFVLDESRGVESQNSKIFMRGTVLVFDLIYVFAVIMFTRTCQANRSTRTQNLALITLLAQPALLLVDHGHFQYNSVMLALTLLSLNFMSTGHDVIAAVLFVASLGFKQMALYYAPAVGSYLLAKCLYLGPSEGRNLFFRLAIATSGAFVVLFLPFLPPFSSPRTILDPITRIFPFGRGLFEDKVANFWCFSNVLVKWRNFLSSEALVKVSTALTALGFFPSVVGLLKNGACLRVMDTESRDQDKHSSPGPLFPLLNFALLTSSFSFFLFSFQVHEKTILVPLLPLTLIMVGSAHDSTSWELGMLGNNVGVFSMWPLLKRDGVAIQYIAMLLLWNASLGYSPFRRPKSFVQYISLVISIACLTVHVLELVVSPPKRYPDIYAVLNVLISTPVFILIWLWSVKRGMEVGWALGGIGGRAQNSSDWERERERRWSSISRGRAADVASNTSGGSESTRSASLIPFEREQSVRIRHQSLGIVGTRKRRAIGSLRTPSTPTSTDSQRPVLAEPREDTHKTH